MEETYSEIALPETSGIEGERNGGGEGRQRSVCYQRKYEEDFGESKWGNI